MIVGIDLGTTNSLVAVWRDGAAQIVPNALGERLTPSVVGVDDNGEILVGAAARERLLTHPAQTAAVFKRYMGSDRVTELGRKHRFRAEELSSLVLRALKADAEAWLGESVAEAIVTVPAYFNDAQRKATRLAGQLAGLKVERLLNEPTAAALAYGLHRRDLESQFLVFDLGGGTFDVSLLELFDGVMEVRASAGDNFLGGEDFVDLLVEGFMREVGRPAGLDLDPPQRRFLRPGNDEAAKLGPRLRDQAERAKRRLSLEDTATLSLPYRGATLRWTVTATDLARLCEPLLQRLSAPVERALRDARIRSRDLDEVVLAGGATRMPIVRRLVAHMFGRLPAGHINPDEVVALGAAVQAGLKAQDAALDDIVMTDVAPYTLGTEVSRSVGRAHRQSGYFLPLIERNSTIPISRVERLSTVEDNQRALLIKVYQGESPWVADNVYLGELKVRIPPRPAGEEQVDLRYTYDINGILEVEVTVLGTGITERLVIEGNPGRLSPQEIEQRLEALAALKIHPRDQAENRALLARAERVYQESLGEVRSFVGDQIALLQALLEDQNLGELAALRTRLAQALDRIEDDRYL